MKAKEKAKNLHTPQFTIRKISSEDDVSGLPRSHCTSQIVSGYADSIRRQRSDSFVHSYNHRKVFHTRTVQKPLQLGADDDDGDVEVDMNENDHGFKPNSNQSSRSDVPSITTTTNTVNSRARNSHTASPKSVAPSSMKSSLHINTNPAATTNRNETGAILEGVLIRRAIRPGSPLTATLPSSQNATLNEPCTPSRLPRITTAALTPTSEISVSPIASATTTTTPSTPSAPWLPPSLITPQHSNITISSLSSGAYDENPVGAKTMPVVSKLQLKSEKTVDDQSNKHPSLFKRLAQFHHSSGSRSYHDEQLHEFMKTSHSATTAILEQDTELDRYGFQKTTQWITLDTYHDFEKYYQPILDRRLLRWQQMLSENESKLPDRCNQVKRYIRKGVPSQLRGTVWFHYSGAKAKMDANPGVYDKFLIRAQGMGDDNEFADLIERDLHRTFPDNIQFSKAATALLSTSSVNDGSLNCATTKSPPAIDALRRVLSAFSVYCPSVGYCQSLNYLVGMLLLFFKEEETFWCISTIAQTILPAGVYDVTMEGASIDQAVLMMLLYERMPQLWYKLTDKTFWEAESDGVSMPTITLVTSHWFLTLFINILPTETVLRVWDCFFYEGSSILFRIALTLFKMSEPIIYGLDDPLEIFQVIQNFPKRIIDCQTLMEYAFRRYGTLSGVSNDDLDRRREICRELRKARRTMTPNELATTRNKLDSTFRKRWKITMNPSTSTPHHHNLGGSRK